jgi:transposase
VFFMTQKFDRDFKLSAIRMASQVDSTAVEVEERLGISKGIISRWKKQLRDSGDEAFPGTGQVSDRDEEIRVLRRELARVSQERDILKKAAAFFAKESR